MTAAIAENTVNQIDALELLRQLPDASVDCVLTDPPYGLAGRIFDVPEKHYSAVNEVWDTVAPTDWICEAGRVLKPGGSVGIFAGRESVYTFASEALRLGWRLVNDITLFKPSAPPNFTGRMMTETTERLLWFCPSGTRWTYNRKVWGRQNGRDVWTMNTRDDGRVHPTQKPLNTLCHFIALVTNFGDLVVDPFGGSGTTAVAARNLGRRWITGDTDAGYCEIMRRRLAEPYTPQLFPEADAVDDAPRQVEMFEATP